MLQLSPLALVLLASACSKAETTTAAPDPSASTISIIATPPAPASAPATAPLTASAPPPSTPTPSATPTPTPSASAAATSKPGTTAKSAISPTAATATAASAAKEPPPPPLKPASTRLSGKNFTLDAASPGCRVDAPCVVTLRLSASGEYHVNKEYPYKFTATPAPGVQFLGNGDPNLFTRAAGDFREEGEKAAVMTVRFKPTATGDARIAGTYKMSVCSAENCQIESQAVSLSVPVM